jgi:hypothetical protein
VRIASDGTVRDLGPFASATSELRLAGGRLYWSEERRDPRWELAGISVIRAMDLATGRRETMLGGDAGRPLGPFLPDGEGPVPAGGRYYNPAPTPDDTRVAAMHYAADGSHQVVIFDGASGLGGSPTRLTVLTAPAGMQPVQGAWIGNALYISAVTDDGFGLFYGYDVCPVECLTCWTDGWVCGTGNLFPKENVDVYNLAKAKKTAEAMKAQEEEVWPYLHLFSKPDSNGDILWLQIIKEGLKMRGVDAGYCRLPVFSSLPEETIIRLKDTLRHFGYLD